MLSKRTKSEIVKYNPEEILKVNTTPANFKHVKTVKLACQDQSDALSVIKKKVGEEVSLAIIKVWIINLNDYLNISRKMNPAQIDETANLIMEEFFYLKTSDIALIFKRIKTGYYGGFYESIDGMKILDMMHQYAEERINMHMNENDRQHRNNKRI